MSRLTRDPLLTIAKALLYLIIGVMIFAMVMVAVGIGALLTVGHAQFTAAIAAEGAPASASWAIIGVMLLVEVLFALIVLFCLQLRRIVLSVDQGDPFHPENATRLTRMAWLSLGLWIVTLPIGAIVEWLDEVLGDAAQIQADGLDTNGLLMALVLFILARVFRRGAEMREDLEGTV